MSKEIKNAIRPFLLALLFALPLCCAADDVLVLDVNGRAQTGRFRVLDHEGDALGLMVAADDKFVAAASTARLQIDGDSLSAEIECPVPDGMKAAKSRSSVWAGDGVEFFVRPSLSSTVYYQYSANAAGVFAARKNSGPDAAVDGWRTGASAFVTETDSGFKVVFKVPFAEVFSKPLVAGDVFGVNFTRAGKTCGGLSTWAAVGISFSNIEAFGRVVYGGVKAYCDRRISGIRAKASAINLPEKFLAGLDGAVNAVSQKASSSSDSNVDFVAVEKMLSDIDMSIVSASHSGRQLLMFPARLPWGNSFAPDGGEKPLDAIRITAARNSRAMYMFAIANLSDKAFLGHLSVVDDRSKAKSEAAGKSGGVRISSRFSVSRGFSVANRAGKMLYDPVAPLLLKSVLQLAPKESAPMYLEFDTRGMCAGSYRATLSLKKAMPGFQDVKVPVEVTVVDADLDEVAVDRAGYDYVGNTFANGDGARNVVRYLVERGYNMVYVGTSRIVPRESKDGGFTIRDFSPLDRHLDAVCATGIPRDRIKLWIYMGLEHNHPWNAPLNVKGHRSKPGDGVWERGVKSMVRQISSRVKQRYGIGKDRIYWYPIDEPSGPIDDPTFKSNMARAYHAAKTIKEDDPANLTMTDPLPVFLASKEIETAMPRLAEVYDVMELYRPKTTAKTKALVAAQNFKEVWTYSISTKETSPVRYRRDTWENMRDGFREISTFWHMTQSAGSNFDSSDFTNPGRFDDYASLYVDFGKDEVMPSRRQIAADMGFEEARLIMWLRNRFKGDAAKLEKIESVVREAADTGTMAAMDRAREELLGMVGQSGLRMCRENKNVK